MQSEGIEAAWQAYETAAERAGVVVETVHDLDDLRRVSELFDLVWPSADGSSQLLPNLMRAIEHSGGYIAAAYDGAVMVGAALAIVGRHDTEDVRNELHLHSHMAAAIDSYRDRHVGTAIKLHQRWWAMDQGIPVITWTFDPLVRRNARFNLVKLGAEIAEYHQDFYGDMDDGINAGDRTDRVLAWWDLDSQRAADSAAGLVFPIDETVVRASGAVDVIRPDASVDADAVGSHEFLLVALPDDIVAIRSASPSTALAWRMAVRAVLTQALEVGYLIETVTDGGSYVLRRPVG